MLNRIKYLILGSPLPTHLISEKRLNKIRALAAFSPDALSSIAYANQEIYLGLVVAGSTGLALSFPIGLAITVVLVIAALSYYQTIQAYPTGGGSYTVARSNLGTLPGLIAAAALMIDYLLTAAVSLTAGVEAIASAFPILWNYRVLVALLMLVVIMLLNLRGLQETGSFMAIPVYLFLFSYIPMLVFGLIRLRLEGPGNLTSASPAPIEPLTLLIILRSFASGCTALTGIEAISNGVPAFQEPQTKNAGRTLLVMAVLMGLLFVGSIGLTQAFAIVANPQETILAALSSHLLGKGFFYLLIQASTMLILAVAANTSFAGFPRMAAILAKDGFLPRQFTALGDRLVFTNGIIVLAAATAFLIIIFGGNTHALVPLFAVGAFLAFTLSQSGMVLHWWRERGTQWRLKALANGLGAFATGSTLIVVGISKFVEGAWITVLVIPTLVILFWKIKGHYQKVGQQLSLRGLPPSLKPAVPCRVVIPISGVHRGIIEAVSFAKSISDQITAVYVELDPETGQQVKETWERWWPDLPLVIVESPYRSFLRPFLEFLDQADEQAHDGQKAIVLLPEFVPAKWWQSVLHNQTAWLLKATLLYHRSRNGGLTKPRIIIDVPYRLER